MMTPSPRLSEASNPHSSYDAATSIKKSNCRAVMSIYVIILPWSNGPEIKDSAFLSTTASRARRTTALTILLCYIYSAITETFINSH
nr:unnamed protein product [Haemonchus contortus]